MASFAFDYDAIERLARCAPATPTLHKKRRCAVRRERDAYISVPSVPARDIARDASGAPLCLNDLPPPGFSGYWTKARKSVVAHAIRGGILSDSEAARRYATSHEELASWKRRFLR